MSTSISRFSTAVVTAVLLGGLLAGPVAAQTVGPSDQGASVPEQPWWTRQGAVVTPPPAVSTVVIPGDVLFDTGSYQLSLAAQSQLASLAETLRSNPGVTALIEGHTDSDAPVGSSDGPAANQMLSVARAQAVANWFEAQGVAASRLDAVGWGQTRPVAANDTPEHKAANRRVVITLKTGAS